MQNFIMLPHRTWALWISIFFISVVLAGCSAARLGYSNGETLSYWWLNKYVDFESDQKPWVKKELAELFAWHRKTQLKSYIYFLKQAQERVQGQVTETDLLADYQDARKRLLLLADQALPQLADLALALQPHQIAHIEEKFTSNNEDYRKEYLRGDLEQRQRHRFKKLRKHVEYWMGDLSDEQEDQLRIAADARPLNNELVLAERIQRQQAILALLKKIQAEKPSREATMMMIKNYIHAALDRFGNKEYNDFFNATRTETVRIVAALINKTTPQQKAHFIKTTQQWINDFTELSK